MCIHQEREAETGESQVPGQCGLTCEGRYPKEKKRKEGGKEEKNERIISRHRATLYSGDEAGGSETQGELSCIARSHQKKRNENISIVFR